MTQDIVGHGWDVYGSNGEIFQKQAEYLDKANQLAGVRAYKNRTYSLLEVQKGDHIIDVGCGVGDDVRALAGLAGDSGKVVGIDNKIEMLREAIEQIVIWKREHESRAKLNMEFHQIDVYELSNFEFGDKFDCCRADRILQHLSDPKKALEQMIQTVRPGGRVVVSEPDWETLVLHSYNDRQLTRKVLNYWADTRSFGWIGRELPTLFKQCGLTNIHVESISLSGPMLNYDWKLDFLALVRSAKIAQLDGFMTAGEVKTWLTNLKEAEQAGEFLANLSGFIVKGEKVY
jgi:ubiquinone/menaquinone biosynthesis C-methylase UbiE